MYSQTAISLWIKGLVANVFQNKVNQEDALETMEKPFSLSALQTGESPWVCHSQKSSACFHKTATNKHLRKQNCYGISFSQGVTAKSSGEEKHFHSVLFPEAEQDCSVESPTFSCSEGVSFSQLLGEKDVWACLPQGSSCATPVGHQGRVPALPLSHHPTAQRQPEPPTGACTFPLKAVGEIGGGR